MGVPINLAREYMGHADIKTTQRIYTHDTEASFNAGAQIIKSYYTTPKRIKARKGRRLKLITGGKE
jgi:hypothetical protein